ncbi:MAG: hypothetical protein ABI183_14935, partial [Polyangiaceae bacterium]
RTLGTLVVIGGTVGLAYGCSAAGNAPIGSDTTDGSTPAANYGDSDEAGSSTGTTPKKDAGSTHSDGGGAYDAGPPKAPEGSPCDSSLGFGDPQATESCGVCGTQTRICSTPDGGKMGVWDIWGSCGSEVTTPDACDSSKVYPATACGNCGTMQQVCGFDCHFETGFDCTEPVGACHPTDTKFVLGASCTTAGQGRAYTCSATCVYGSPSACELPPPNPNTITISPTVGTTVTAPFSLTSGATTPKIDASCPATLATTATPFIDIAIVNPTARNVTVSLWNGPTSGSSDLDTIMAWYPTPVAPPSDMTACSSASDDCSGSDCANTGAHSGWSSLSGTDAASIPAGGTITVYVGGYTSSVTGNFTLHAKTEN